MYADGGAEEVVGEAVQGHRDEVFLVSKVLPHNASLRGTVAACEHSLKRLGSDHIDLYLLHWPGNHPLEDTLTAFAKLVEQGKIRYWGVSNFDVGDLEELLARRGGAQCATNQILYNLTRRGIEWDLLPWSRQHRMPQMAYSPVEQGRLLSNPTLGRVAARHSATVAQVALAWVLRSGAIAIPRSRSLEHVRENRASLDIVLTETDLGDLDRAFPPPRRKHPLEML